MSETNPSTARALAAVDDTAELLRLAERAVERASHDCSGEALGVAERLRQQIQFLHKVAGLLRHEIERPAAVQKTPHAGEIAKLDEPSAV